MKTEDVNRILRQPAEFRLRHWYSALVADWVGDLPDGRVLEVGCDSARIVPGSTSMDVRPRGITAGPLDMVHDARKPWPFPDKHWDLVIALEVWEHLESDEAKAFLEAVRCSKRTILSLPYLWPPGGLFNHDGIDEDKIKLWTCGIRPSRTAVVYKEFGYPHWVGFWDMT